MFTAQPQTGRIYRKYASRWAVPVLLAVTLCGCTSAIALGTLYNSAASRFSKELLSYAEFTNRQQQEIRRRVSAFHQWHRQDQLPKYRMLTDRITAALEAPQSVKINQIADWINTARQLAKQAGHCSPLNGSGLFLKELSDQQTRQIAVKIRDKHIQRVGEYQSETAEQRLEQRRRTLEKWGSRAGIKMTSAQRQRLQDTLAAQISLSPRRHELWQTWSDQLVGTLRKRGTAGFETTINQHIHTLWNLTEKTYPEEWQTNITLWQNFVFDFFQLMTPDQARQLQKTLNNISVALGKLQNKRAKFEAQCFASIQ